MGILVNTLGLNDECIFVGVDSCERLYIYKARTGKSGHNCGSTRFTASTLRRSCPEFAPGQEKPWKLPRDPKVFESCRPAVSKIVESGWPHQTQESVFGLHLGM